MSCRVLNSGSGGATAGYLKITATVQPWQLPKTSMARGESSLAPNAKRRIADFTATPFSDPTSDWLPMVFRSPSFLPSIAETGHRNLDRSAIQDRRKVSPLKGRLKSRGKASAFGEMQCERPLTLTMPRASKCSQFQTVLEVAHSFHLLYSCCMPYLPHYDATLHGNLQDPEIGPSGSKRQGWVTGLFNRHSELRIRGQCLASSRVLGRL
jgi:hypothetical protein